MSAGSRRLSLDGAARGFRELEQVLYVIVALALGIMALGLFVQVVYRFIVDTLLEAQPFIGAVLQLLDGLLLVFIVTELLHTVRAVIATRVLLSEPFLIVGIVAAIRRIIVISAEAPDAIATREFADLMVEMAVLIGAVLVLGFTIFLLRHTHSSEPTPSHEPG